MASFAVNTLKAQKAAILFDFNSPYGRGLTRTSGRVLQSSAARS
jgi:hypothetical protein